MKHTVIVFLGPYGAEAGHVWLNVTENTRRAWLTFDTAREAAECMRAVRETKACGISRIAAIGGYIAQ